MVKGSYASSVFYHTIAFTALYLDLDLYLNLPYCHTYGVATYLNLSLNLKLPYCHTYGV